jgi:ubiquinone biosynthesis protein UbiJ
MATQSPFSFLDGFFERVLAGPQPPQWLVHEVQHRLVLFLNHVLMQEKEAMDRLARQSGRVARVQWRVFSMALRITPAGLFDLAPPDAQPDLRLEVSETSPLALARGALGGDRPTIRIEGDVRWDVEEDLARVIGDAPAHAVASVAGRAAEALRRFVGGRVSAASDRSPP